LVNYSPLVLVLVVVTATLGAALLVLGRWSNRYLRGRRAARLDPEQRALLEQLRQIAPRQRRVEWLTFVLGAGTFLCVSWGLFVEPDWLEVTEHHIKSQKLLPHTSIKVVQLSDLHSEAKLHIEAEVIAAVARLRPDIIVFTGDALNEAAGLANFRQTIAALAKIAPTYGVYGNWETWWFPDLDLYGSTGARLLNERASSINIRGQTIWLVGVGVDREAQLTRATQLTPRTGFKLLLHHFPALAPRAAQLGFDVMLAGDTHGGQARLPWLGELVRIKRRGYWKSSGMHRESSMWLYVNRGLGNEGGLPRFRWGCRPELSVIYLEST